MAVVTWKTKDCPLSFLLTSPTKVGDGEIGHGFAKSCGIANLVPRAHFSLGQRQEHGIMPGPISAQSQRKSIFVPIATTVAPNF